LLVSLPEGACVPIAFSLDEGTIDVMLGHKLANNFGDAGRHRNGFDQIVSGATKILRLQQGCRDCKKLVAGPDIAGRKATHKCGTGAARLTPGACLRPMQFR
jgi:hypothetical protein